MVTDYDAFDIIILMENNNISLMYRLSSHQLRERFIKKGEKKLTKISFRQVRVAENFEQLFFFFFSQQAYIA